MSNCRFDLFISYSSRDKDIVHDIAGRLQATGLKIFLDAWEIPFFSRLVDQLQDGVEKSRACLIFYSRHAEESSWVRQEWRSFLERSITEKEFVIGVVRLDKTELPIFLKSWVRRDLSEATKEQIADFVRTVARGLHVPESVIDDVSNKKIWTIQTDLSLRLFFTLKALELKRDEFKGLWRIADILRKSPNFMPRALGKCECGGVRYCGYADMGSGPDYFDSYFHICDTCFKNDYSGEVSTSTTDSLPRCPWCDKEWRPFPIANLGE